MEPLTLEMLRALARERGLTLTEPSWPGCSRSWRRAAGRSAGLDALLARDDEPASHFHIL